MKIRYFLLVLFFARSFSGVSQKSFSEDKEVFFNQVIAGLHSLGTEPADKVAFDFENAWRGKFTSANQDTITSIAIQMQRRGYNFQPDFWYYFCYLAFSMEQAHLQNDEVTKILRINDQVVKSMDHEEYQNFLLGLNNYMARRYLSFTKNVVIQTDAGSFSFELLDQYVAPETTEVEMVDIEIAPVISPEPIQSKSPVAQVDPWATDPWGSDPWASDPWGGSTSNTADDPWGDSQQQEDDPWGDQNSEPAAPATRAVVMGFAENYVATQLARYRKPPQEGPIIRLENNSMVISTPYDSLRFREFDGVFLLKTRELLGTDGKLHWPNKVFETAEVVIKDFYLQKDRADFMTPHASLTAPDLFAGSTDGLFEFKSVRRKEGQPSRFPMFTSNQNDAKMTVSSGINYSGGIRLAGNRLFGTSVSKTPGKLEILDGKGNRLVFRGEFFAFRPDSTIISPNTSITLIHDGDSLHHLGVSMAYDIKSKQLTAYRLKKYNTLPYTSSYFKMNINADVIKWDLKTDSIDFSILNGQDLVPATFESDDYFSVARFQKMASGFNFNPIMTFVFYARKYGIDQFNTEELITEFKLSRQQATGAAIVLARYGFADYDAPSGKITLFDKAFHYYDASGGKVDYDNIMLPSLSPGAPNATVRLDSGQLIVRGVNTFFLTADFKVTSSPDHGKLVVLKDRNLKMDGYVKAGDFTYNGHDFQFDYDGFLIRMNKIDSIRIEVHDSLATEGHESLPNDLTETSGVLYLDVPNDKSGIKDSEAYPYFASNSEAIVYFDRPEVLGGAYDRSVKFIVPPFEEDSIDIDAAISFEGRFNSGKIFPEFDETLRIMPDKSLGFVHQIPKEGYNLYGTAAKTYEKITLSNDGLRGGGKIDFITSTLYSDDFVYYPDSVAAYGYQGFIGAGQVGSASYPEAVLGPYRMYWYPRIDSMYLQNLREPFKFYNATATLSGAIDITTKGVYGSGTMLTRGSKSISKELTFKQYSYSARHAKFSVLTDNPQKPAMAGNDIRLNFDLTKNVADIHPEKEGVAAISFPYAQMKTSITNAIWDLEDSVVTMTKPANVPIEKSYFYSTRKELDSLVFNASQGSYDFNTKKLNIRGIPYILVADAKIIPEGNQTTILENSELQTFENAQVIIDTVNEYHHLTKGNIKVISRNEFIGDAMYELTTGENTYDIRFDSFVLQDVYVTDNKKKRMTVSGGDVLDKQNVLIAPGFFYKGSVKMFAYKKALELEGSVKLNLKTKGYDYWVQYNRKNEDDEVKLDFTNAVFEDEEKPVAGLQYDIRGSLYTTFVEKRKSAADEDFFLPKGVLTFDPGQNTYKIEAPTKSSGESYEGYTMIYNDSSESVIFEGPVNFFSPFVQKVKVKGSVLGLGNKATGEYSLDAFITLDFPGLQVATDMMAADLLDIVERLGPPLANDNSLELLYKLANITSDKLARTYETASLKEYIPLVNVSENLWKSIVLSGVKMKWSESNRAWYNTTKLAISNINRKDVNAKLDGFLEIKKDGSNNDVLNLFIQAAPGTWYFISYNTDNLLFFSSNKAFNEAITAKSNLGAAKIGELTIVEGDENETLSFLNSFLENYFGITEPYNLVYPDEISLEEEENFETIEKKDDGFGF